MIAYFLQLYSFKLYALSAGSTVSRFRYHYFSFFNLEHASGTSVHENLSIISMIKLLVYVNLRH